MIRSLCLAAISLGLILGGCQLKEGTSSSDTEVKELLERVFIAIDQYTSVKKKPINAQIDQDGVIHSWRVAIYPWLSSNEFFGRYNFQEPYDSPSNLAASRSVRLKEQGEVALFDPSSFFRTKSGSASGSNWTSVLMITTVGEVELNERGKVPDGNENTILIVFFSGSKVHWTEPTDLTVNKDGTGNAVFEAWLQEPEKIVLFRDGKIRRLSSDVQRKEIVAMCTLAGGESINAARHQQLK
ncbi:DUF1559 domain-containing protein [Pirellulaceae bacterium SH467]